MESTAFLYKPLRDDRPQFRDEPPKFQLFHLGEERYGEIKCELIEALLDTGDMIPYVAIPHRWDSGRKNKFIWIGECKVAVSDSVFCMLDALRAAEHRHLWYDPGFFWIDTICINQSNDVEKSHQVSQMREIYANARVFIVWLGKASKETDLIMTALVALQNEVPKRNLLPDDPNWNLAWRKATSSALHGVEAQELSHSFNTLLSHSWFRRAWVLQEISNAQSAFILCGNKSISTKYFVMGTRFVAADPSSHCQSVLELMPSPARKIAENADLFNLLRRFRAAEATEPIDRIFFLLGLCSDKTGTGILLPNYGKPLRVIIR